MQCADLAPEDPNLNQALKRAWWNALLPEMQCTSEGSQAMSRRVWNQHSDRNARWTGCNPALVRSSQHLTSRPSFFYTQEKNLQWRGFACNGKPLVLK
ncbi:hypothetical protein BCY86_02725 [Pajaroellobacter abortibovis]|uniref:Uncharacterized protein n=1 Tax=Pajaroellobacter abortibovis TaxID=1882918 RepID=A0A1L6MWA1_9BACT|nr:hypothetical protein BCY86_02725 [Pajaroellobacter abortibovis]